MITYQQLCDQQQKYNDELNKRRNKLRQLISEFCQAISQNLGLSDKYYNATINEVSATVPYVKLLELNSDEHQHIHVMELPIMFDEQGDPIAEAGISLTLEKSPNTYPKQSVFIRIEFTLKQNILILRFTDFDDGLFKVTVNLDDDNRFAYAVEAYKQLVKPQKIRPHFSTRNPCGGFSHPKFTKSTKKESKWKSLLMYLLKSHAL